MNPAIQTDNLRFAYKDKPVLDGVSLSIERGRDGRHPRSQRVRQNDLAENFFGDLEGTGRCQGQWQKYRDLRQEGVEPAFRHGARKRAKSFSLTRWPRSS